ncbi:MAG: 5'-nucleotidase [Chlorobi bacterium OLB7]|nr:MAG: 5'-nucleotidase [Chlorobi bacterium OLB7]
MVNFDMTWVGTVDLSASGVQYVLGKDATSQGLGETTPNPVVSNDARLPYSLTEPAHVSIDLYSVSGDHVARLVDDKFIPGNYTVALPLDNMNNGAYVVRMLANGKAYSSKLSVVR